MTVWAIADLHLAISVPDKSMEVFGPRWQDYHRRIQDNWMETVKDDDLVLLPGDITWAKHLDEASVDFEWIDELPGTKVMIRGNHDYWWGSLNKMAHYLPASVHPLHNSVYTWNEISIGGARLWDTPEYSFDGYIDFIKDQPVNIKPKLEPKEQARQDAKIFERELNRLDLSLQQLDQKAKKRIVMTHYPPISATLDPSSASKMLEDHNVDICCFGHLHNVKLDAKMFGSKNGVDYRLVAADSIDFRPVKIMEE